MTLQTHRLSNGFRIVTENMPGLASASIGVWVGAGGRHETPAQNGIAHFLEHMAFKGTKTRTALQIAEAIEDVGGYINAYTSREVTAYYVRVLENDVPLGLEVIADILRNPVMDDAEIEVERGVILQEIGQALDTPDDVIFDWLQEQAYPDQPMGRTILGPSERVSNFNRSDLTGFIDQHYGPEQMILSAAGAVDHDALVAMAEKLFGDMKPKPLMQALPGVFAGGEHRQTKELEQAHFALGFESPGYRADDIYVAQIYASALGGGMSSRLFQEVRENRGLCYTIFAQAGAYADTGMMTVYAGTSGDQLPELAGITIDEMKRAASDMSPAEVARARAQMKAGLLMGLESPSNRAERLARLIQIWDRIPPLEETIAQIDAVTTGDVRDFAERMAVSAPAALALYGPVASAPTLQALEARRAALMFLARRKLKLETERMTLRAPTHNDFRPWVALRSASREFLTPWEPAWSPDHLSRKAFANRVYWANRSINAGTAMPLFLVRRSDQTLLGAITLDNIRRGPALAGTLGYWTGAAFARQGYMREAIETVVHYAFTHLELSRIEAACLPENKASRGLLERSGFKYEGVAQSYLQIDGRWRTHVLYASLRGDRRGKTTAA